MKNSLRNTKQVKSQDDVSVGITRVKPAEIVAILFVVNGFTALSQLLGVEHNRTIYIAYSIFLFVAGVLVYINALLRGERIRPWTGLGFGLVATLVLFAIFAFFISTDANVVNNAMYFVVFAIPAFLTGSYFGSGRRYRALVKYFDLIIILLLLASISFFLTGRGEITVSETGANYQNASYFSGIAMGLDVLLLAFPNESLRFGFAKTPFYRFLQIVFIPVLLIMSLASGGRGGALLCLLFLVWFFFYCSKELSRWKIVFRLLFVGAAFFTVAVNFFDVSMLSKGIERFLDLFQSDAFSAVGNASQNSISSRNVLRNESVMLIGASPVYGYGFFNYYSLLNNYPHNLFLELLLQGGLVYLILFLIIVAASFVSAARNASIDEAIRPCLAIAVYVVVFLMFSGTYMTLTEFWFTLGLFLASFIARRNKGHRM